MQPSIPDFCPACDAADHPFALIQRETDQDFRSKHTFAFSLPGSPALI
jgi:hypothetical protein